MTWNSTLKPGKPLAKRSAKRVSEDREFAKVREFVMERDKDCKGWARLADLSGTEVDLAGSLYLCFGPRDPHHIVPVARDVTLRLEPTNLITLCRRHHDWVHQHPLEAEALGLLKSVAVPSPDPQKSQT